MEDTIRLYRTLFGNRAYLRSVWEGVVFLAASAIAIFAAVSYATVHASNYVTDFVLSRVGPLNVRFLFIYGTFTAFVITAGLLAWRPNRLPFALKAMALFLLVRAVFVSLTHIAPSPIDPQQPAPFFNSIFYGGDLFFSGHTGLPFLAALAFWHIPQWRMFYLALTAFFGGGRAARPLSLFDRCARRIVHHPRRLPDFVLAVRPRLCAVSLFRESGRATTEAGGRKTFARVGEPGPPSNRSCCTSSARSRCRPIHRKPIEPSERPGVAGYPLPALSLPSRIGKSGLSPSDAEIRLGMRSI